MKSAYGINIPQTLQEVSDLKRVALLVYDMQLEILSQIKNPEQITQQVIKSLSAARDAGLRVFFSRHVSLPKELIGMVHFRMVSAWQRANSLHKVTLRFLYASHWLQVDV